MYKSNGCFWEYLSTYNKNPAHTLTHSWEIQLSSILQSSLLETFRIKIHKHEVFRMWPVQWKVKNYNNFHFRLFLGKQVAKFVKKKKNNLFLNPFCPNMSNILPNFKISKRINLIKKASCHYMDEITLLHAYYQI